MTHILSTEQFKKEEVEKILSDASLLETQLKEGSVSESLKNKIVACIFFEPSTRTRLSFETAALRLGAKVISAEDASSNSSTRKGETVEDTARMLSCYADIIVMRHFEANSAERAAKVATKPVVNAGDGTNQHPSQGLLDLYTIKKEHGRLEDLSLAFVGDLLNSRTLHSLVPLLNLYKNNKFYFISPKELKLSADFKKSLKERGVIFKESENLEEILPEVDVLYMTRVQKERFKDKDEYEKVKDSFLLKIDHVNKLKKDAIIMHPLPRINEIDKKIDEDSKAAYFRQAENAVFVRMALLSYCVNN